MANIRNIDVWFRNENESEVLSLITQEQYHDSKRWTSFMDNIPSGAPTRWIARFSSGTNHNTQMRFIVITSYDPFVTEETGWVARKLKEGDNIFVTYTAKGKLIPSLQLQPSKDARWEKINEVMLSDTSLEQD